MSDIEYTVIKSNRKTMALEVTSDARLIVRAPRFITPWAVEGMIESKQDWIEKNLQQARRKQSQIKEYSFVDGEELYLLGQTVVLKVDPEAKRFRENDGPIVGQWSRDKKKRAIISWYKRTAKKVFTQRADELARTHNLNFKAIKVTSASKRWGSCSSRNNLNFTWRLVMAPSEVIDYVICHELAHTVHKNHGKQFWRLVSEICPNYKNQQSWLRQHGHKLIV